MKSKQFLVRVPAHELAAIETVFRYFPGASPAEIMRALVLSAGKIEVANALAKQAAHKVSSARKGFQ
jgi:hypothetical protein